MTDVQTVDDQQVNTTDLSVVVYEVPPGSDVGAFYRTLTDKFGDLDGLNLAERLEMLDVPIGGALEVAEDLAETGCTFELREEAAYEFPGVLVRHTPQMGMHVALMDNSGRITLTADEIMEMAEESVDLSGFVDAAEERYGIGHDWLFSTLEQMAQELPEEQRPTIDEVLANAAAEVAGDRPDAGEPDL